MINLKKKADCCGCGACVSACPKGAISLHYDEEGFLYPAVDKDLCVNCSLCNKACPKENEYKRNTTYAYNFLGAYNNDKAQARASSSGGIFSLLAQHIILQKGAVYGVELLDDFKLVHSRADSLDGYLKFRKSKYLESNTNNVFRKVKEDLNIGLKVLFSGTPCQVAGLHSFLGKEYENLYTCDVVCHGVPSRMVFDKYIEELNKKQKSKAVSACWRDKENGWYPNKVTIFFEDGSKKSTTSTNNPYQAGFLHNLYLRPSCYVCNWAKLPRVGDISLADFWGYKGPLLNDNENAGISIVVISSKQGAELFDKCKDKINFHPVSKEEVMLRSRHIYKHPKAKAERALFFKDLKEKGFYESAEKYLYSKDYALCRFFFRVLDKLRDMIK